jgi:hypothetical protein
LDIFLRGFSLSSCPQHSLKVLLLLNVTCLLKYALNCEQIFSFFFFRSGLSGSLTNCNRIGEGLVYFLYKTQSIISLSRHKIFHFKICYVRIKTKLRGFSPQANYTDRATAACRRS